MKEIEGKARKTAYVDVRMHLFWIFVGVVALILIYAWRDQLTSQTLFLGTLGFGIPTGMLLGIVLNRFS